MPIGPGIYDKHCTRARIATGARACLLIIMGGEQGDGFACQADLDTTLRLPELLERIAAEIRASLEQGKL